MADTRLHPLGSMPTYGVRAPLVPGSEHLPVEDGSFGSWASVRVSHASGMTACPGVLLAMYLDLTFRRVHLGLLAKPLIAEVSR